MVTRYVGICQICEKTHKLYGRRLVHHGYVVKDRQFQKDCSGVNEVPYELSCDFLRTNLKSRQPARASLGT